MSLYFDNNKLFDAEGHLTDEGLYAIKDGTLDDLGALEAAEHLSFCDYCLLRYTAMIDAAPDCMKQPMRDLIPQIKETVGRGQHLWRAQCRRPAAAAARRPAGTLRHQIQHRRQRLLQEPGRHL